MSVILLRQSATADATSDHSLFFAEETAKALAQKPSSLEWSSLRRIIAAWCRDPWQFSKAKPHRVCPNCTYKGVFISVGWPSRWEARCPKCASRERHRLMFLWLKANSGTPIAGKRILHFAPEKTFQRMLKNHPGYETADLAQPGVTHRLDVTNITQPDASFDVVIAHHLLEHIDDDRKAMSEFYRILKPGGFAILSVPVNGTRQETYEDDAVVDRDDRLVHFGGHDHKRYYGLDFIDRLVGAGFETEVFRPTPAAEVAFSLLRDEWIYIAHKR